MPVSDIANQDVVTAGTDDSLADVAQTMDEENVGSVVVTENDEPSGIVTDRQIALAVGEGEDAASQTASDVMTENPVTIDENEEGFAVAETMGEAKVRRLPVVDEDDRLTGIVTLDDVVSVSGEQLEYMADVIEAQSPGYDAN